MIVLARLHEQPPRRVAPPGEGYRFDDPFIWQGLVDWNPMVHVTYVHDTPGRARGVSFWDGDALLQWESGFVTQSGGSLVLPQLQIT